MLKHICGHPSEKEPSSQAQERGMRMANCPSCVRIFAGAARRGHDISDPPESGGWWDVRDRVIGRLYCSCELAEISPAATKKLLEWVNVWSKDDCRLFSYLNNSGLIDEYGKHCIQSNPGKAQEISRRFANFRRKVLSGCGKWYGICERAAGLDNNIKGVNNDNSQRKDVSS